jgi:tRNA (adenine57-N1/adenine58-N1)-methyltransferase catalytic subunit
LCRLRVDNLITVQCHDLCEPEAGPDTGGFLGVSPQSLDAIFLDLPEPWRALKYVPSVLKPNRSICCYSPCVEQVMKTCDKLRELGFHSIKMFEVRQKPHTAFNISMETADIGQPDSAGTCGVAREEEEPTSKKTKREDGSSSGADSSLTICGGGTGGKHYRPRTLPGVPVKVARPDATMKGHTAYLTFATAPTAFPKK